MKFRYLLSLLFLLGITLASIHELEHINGDHQHPSCEICSLSDSLHGAENIKTDSFTFPLPERKITQKIFCSLSYCKATTNHPNAPPSPLSFS